MERESGGSPALVPAAAADYDTADSSSGDDEQPVPSEFDPYDDIRDIADRFYAYEIEEIPSFRWMTRSQREISPSLVVNLHQESTRIPQCAPEGDAPEGGGILQIKLDGILSCKRELESHIHQTRYRLPAPEVEFWFQKVETQQKEVKMLLNRGHSNLFPSILLRRDVAKKLKELDQLLEQRAKWISDDMIMKIPLISADEIKEVTDNFARRSLVSEDSTGGVYYAVLKNGLAAAIRIVYLKQTHEEFMKQVFLVSSLKHENVVELVGYCADENLRALAYEAGTMQSLYDILHGTEYGVICGQNCVNGGQPGPVLSWAARAKIVVQVSRGLEYLHKKAQPAEIHRCIRSSNVLLFDDHVAKIAHCILPQGPVTRSSRNATMLCRSCTYMDPERIRVGIESNPVSDESDIYSFGVVLLELLTGRNPYTVAIPNHRDHSVVLWAKPLLTEDKVKWCVDPKLGGEYPPKEAAKVAAVAALCLQYESRFRPSTDVVVKALSRLWR